MTASAIPPSQATSSEPCQAAVRHSIRRNFSWTLAGNLVYAACQWGSLIAIARFGGQSMVGEFSLALAICAPIMMLADMNLRGLQSTDVQREYKIRDYLALRGMSLILAMAIIVAVAVLSDANDARLVIVVVAAAKCAFSLSEVWHGLFQQREQMHFQAKSYLIRGPLCLLLLVVSLAAGANLVVSVIVMSLGELAVLLAFDLPSGQRLLSQAVVGTGDRTVLVGLNDGTLPARWSPAKLIKLAILAFPLGITGFFNSLRINFPRYVVAASLGVSELGAYGVMVYSLVLMETLIKPARMALLPTLARLSVENPRAFLKQLGKYSVGIGVVGVGTTLMAIVGGEWFLSTVYGVQYGKYASIFMGMIAVESLVGLVGALATGTTAIRRFRVQMVVNVAGLIAVALACWTLIPKVGIWGAVYATAIGAVVRGAGFALVLRRYLAEMSVDSRPDHLAMNAHVLAATNIPAALPEAA